MHIPLQNMGSQTGKLVLFISLTVVNLDGIREISRTAELPSPVFRP